MTHFNPSLYSINDFLKSAGLRDASAKPLKVILTHTHFDHSGGAHQLSQVHMYAIFSKEIMGITMPFFLAGLHQGNLCPCQRTVRDEEGMQICNSSQYHSQRNSTQTL